MKSLELSESYIPLILTINIKTKFIPVNTNGIVSFVLVFDFVLAINSRPKPTMESSWINWGECKGMNSNVQLDSPENTNSPKLDQLQYPSATK